LHFADFQRPWREANLPLVGYSVQASSQVDPYYHLRNRWAIWELLKEIRAISNSVELQQLVGVKSQVELIHRLSSSDEAVFNEVSNRELTGLFAALSRIATSATVVPTSKIAPALDKIRELVIRLIFFREERNRMLVPGRLEGRGILINPLLLDEALKKRDLKPIESSFKVEPLAP
jgi:hypothetical protein